MFYIYPNISELLKNSHKHLPGDKYYHLNGLPVAVRIGNQIIPQEVPPTNYRKFYDTQNG